MWREGHTSLLLPHLPGLFWPPTEYLQSQGDQVRAGLDGYVRGEGWETIIFIADDQLKFQDSRINLKYIVPCVVQQVYFVPTESKMLSAAAELNINIL